MKRIILAAAVAACANFTAAQAADIPKAKCEPKPEYPGRLAMQSETRRKSFRAELERYKNCVDAYVTERRTALKAEEEAANAAINEYNDAMRKIKEDEKAANEN